MMMTTMVNTDDIRDGWLLDPLNKSRTECQRCGSENCYCVARSSILTKWGSPIFIT